MANFDDCMRAAERRLEALPLEILTVEAGGRSYRIEAVRDHERLLAAAGDCEPFPFGVLLWESAIVLGDVLAEGASMKDVSVLELGAGTGVAGLVAASLGAVVVQTDYSCEALALCRWNAAANGMSGIDVRWVDWRNWHGDDMFDVVIAADILYEPELYSDIAGVLETVVRPGGAVLMTDPGRIHAPRFWVELERAGWAVTAERRMVEGLPPNTSGKMIGIDVIRARRL
ncbi:MAG: class I SAM-dependent methyltransferase [Deltaproteobacteria bacterium]